MGGRQKWRVPFSMCQCRYCPECKNDSTEVIAAGEKLRFSKKKSNMMSKKSECNRDWGKVGKINITQFTVFVGTCCDIDSSQVFSPSHCPNFYTKSDVHAGEGGRGAGIFLSQKSLS